ncbi:L-selectin-like isoform X2 [Lampetra planeri]
MAIPATTLLVMTVVHVLGSWHHVTARSFHQTPKLSPWRMAMTHCKTHHTELLVLRSVEELDHLNALYPPRKLNYWLGLRKVPSGWQWISSGGAPLGQGVAQWGPGEPNNMGGQQACADVALGKSAPLGPRAPLNDASCNMAKFGICAQGEGHARRRWRR